MKDSIALDGRGSRYVNSVIGSYKLSPVLSTDITIPKDAAFGVIEGYQLTLYRKKTRHDLFEIPASWRGKTERFEPVIW